MLWNQRREIQEAFELILGAPLDFRVSYNVEEERLKENFIQIIDNLVQALERQKNMEKLGINSLLYDDKFFRIIEDLIHFCFDAEAAEAILFYIYARTTDDSQIQLFTDPQGKHHKFESIDDLWEYMLVVAEKLMDEEE